MTTKSIEKKTVSVSIASLIGLVVFVAGMVFQTSQLKADFEKTDYDLYKKVALMEESITSIKERVEKNYGYTGNMKSELKDEIEKNTEKLDKIYSLLLKR